MLNLYSYNRKNNSKLSLDNYNKKDSLDILNLPNNEHIIL